MSFYQTNNKILTKSINGAETIDFNKYPDLLDILFNHWICQKENYNRIKKGFNRGEFEMSLAIIEDTFNISRKKARGLMKRFIDEEIIKLERRGSNSSKKSIYIYLSALEKIQENEGTVKGIVGAQQGHSETLKNECVQSGKGHSKSIVEGTVKGNSKKELIKRINKKDIYSKIQQEFNSTCKGLPSIKKISDAREKAIDARIKEYDLETVLKVFKIASKSSYLNGYNKRNWKANFDWIMNPNNFLKVFEGNYNSNSKAHDPVEEKTNSEIIDGYKYETI